MKQLIVWLLAALVLGGVALAADQTTEINVTACSGGTSCTAANYNVNDTTIAHTISKSEIGVTDTWSNVPFSTDAVIKKAILHLRHDGNTGISGSWTITVRNEAASSTYCTNNSITHVTSDTYDTWDTGGSSGSCSWTTARLNDLEIAYASGDGAGPTDAFITYSDLYITYNEIPIADTVLDANSSVNIGDDIYYNITASDDEGDNYRVTVCDSNGINNAYPGTCTGNTLCTTPVTSSGNEAQCNYTTTAGGTINSYAFLCDEGSQSCNSTPATASTTVTAPAGWLNVSIDLPSDNTAVNYQETFTLNASLICEGDTSATCGTVYRYVRYNNSGTTPDTNMNFSIGEQEFYSSSTLIHDTVSDEGDGTADSQYSAFGDSSTNNPHDIYPWFTASSTMTINQITVNISGTSGTEYDLGLNIYFCTSRISSCSYVGCTQVSSNYDITWAIGPQDIPVSDYNVTKDIEYYLMILSNSSDGDSGFDELRLAVDSSPTVNKMDRATSTCVSSSDYADVVYSGTSTPDNPENCGSLNKDGTCNVTMSITYNSTGTSYEIDVFWNSSDARVSSNNTADKTVYNLTGGGGGGGDTCTYSGGDHTYDCSDSCTISSNTDLGGNDVTFSGSGTTTITARLYNYSSATVDNTCQLLLAGGSLS